MARALSRKNSLIGYGSYYSFSLFYYFLQEDIPTGAGLQLFGAFAGRLVAGHQRSQGESWV